MHPTHHPPAPVEVDVTPADILRGAALYLQRHGWTQGDYYDRSRPQPFPPACAAGAVQCAVTGAPVTDLDEDQRPHVDRALGVLADYLNTESTDRVDPDPDVDTVSPVGVVS